MWTPRIATAVLAGLLTCTSIGTGQNGSVPQCDAKEPNCSSGRIPVAAKLFLEDMNGFEGELRMALEGVSTVELVESREAADFVVSGWVKVGARHKGAVSFDAASPAEAAMSVKSVRSGAQIYYHHIRVRFAGQGSRDAAHALSRDFSSYMDSPGGS